MSELQLPDDHLVRASWSDLSGWRQTRVDYLSNRDIRRSASGLPPV